MRICKLIKLLWESYAGQGAFNAERNEESLRNLQKSTAPSIQKAIKHWQRVKRLVESGRTENVKVILEEMINKNLDKEKALAALGHIHLRQENYQDAEELLTQAVSLNPDNTESHELLGAVYLNLGIPEKATAHFERALDLGAETDGPYNFLEQLYRSTNSSQKKIKALYAKRGVSVQDHSDRPTAEVTRYHYQKFYQILKAKGINYIAMQYPTRDVGELKKIFKGDEDIIFISNKENFEQALREGTHEDYFIDLCYKDFGHATQKGNELIAKNVANVILTTTYAF